MARLISAISRHRGGTMYVLRRPATLALLLGLAGCPATPPDTPPGGDLAGADLTGVPPGDMRGSDDLRSCTLGTQWEIGDQLAAMTGRRTAARRIIAGADGKLWV